MSRQQQFNDALAAIADDLDGFLGAAVVDGSTGMALASRPGSADFDLDIAAAYNSEMLKAKSRTLKALDIDSPLEELLLTLKDQYHMIRILEDDLFLYTAVYSKDTTLAMMRTVVNQQFRKFG